MDFTLQDLGAAGELVGALADTLRIELQYVTDGRETIPEAFDRVRLEHNSGVICLEMMKKIQDAGFRIAEVPVHHYHRAFGRSQFFNFSRLARTAVDVARLWWQLVVLGRHRQTDLVDSAERRGL